MVKKIVYFLLFIQLVACSSARPTKSVTFAEFNAANVNSFTLFARDSAFFTSQSIVASTRNRIELSLEQAMEQQGYKYAAMADADVIVSYYLIDGDVAGLNKYNQAVRYCADCNDEQRFWYAGHDLSNGTVIIDLLDRQLQRSVWRGLARVPERATRSTFRLESAQTEAIHQVIASLKG